MGFATYTSSSLAWSWWQNEQYELHDHLGDVRATIDMTAPTTSLVKDVTSYFNNYAFGSPHPGRAFDVTGYSFGFNGQEKKNDYMGVGNENHALYWEYETRIGRRWNLDPKPQVCLSDYATFKNNPISYNDFLGNTAEMVIDAIKKTVTFTL